MSDKGTTIVPDPSDEFEDDAPIEGGSFTQAQVNAIVQDRLARQRRKLNSQSELSKADFEATKAELEKAKARLQRYDERSTKLLEDKRKGLPEPVLKLLEKLDPDEQIEWIEQNAEKLTVVTPPASTGPTAPKPKETQVDSKDGVGNVSPAGIHYGI